MSEDFGTSFHFTRGQYEGLGGTLFLFAILMGVGVTTDFLIPYGFFWLCALGWCMNINQARQT